MAFNNIFINFESKKIFLGPKGIGMYTDDQNTTLNEQWENQPDSDGYIGQIPWIAIVEIQETNELWSHGKYIGGNINGNTVRIGGETIVVPSMQTETRATGIISSAANLQIDLVWNEIPKAIYDNILNENGTYVVQIEWGKLILSGVFAYKELHQNTQYNILSDCPVINTDCEIPLTPCGFIQPNSGQLFLKLSAGSRTTTERVAGTNIELPTKPSLFIACAASNQPLNNLTFKFRRII